METNESGATSTQPADAGASTSAPAAPGTGMGGTAGATPSWSLDSWKDDQWDALPERIRKAADARYQPQLSERDKLVAQHQAERDAAKKAAEDARAQWLKGSPFGAEDLKKAQEALKALQTEHDGYKLKYNDDVLGGRAKEWQSKWDEASKASQEKYAARLQAELALNFPWSVQGTKEAPNPAYDAVAMAEADRLTTLIDDSFGLTDLPDSVILTVAKMNEAQRHTFVNALAADQPWQQALEAARKPASHTPSPAARTQAAPNVRPTKGTGNGARVDRSALRSAAQQSGPGLRHPQS